MFKIVDCERLPEDLFRLVVETDDSSLLTSLSFLDSLVEFTGSFRYRAAVALRTKDNQPAMDILYQKDQEDRQRYLQIYESLSGSQKDKWHLIWKEVKATGKDWMRLDDVIVMLRNARSERKEKLHKNFVGELNKKSA